MTLQEMLTPTFQYRPVDENDIPATVELLARAYVHYYEPAWLKAQYESGRRYGWESVRILEADGVIVATATIFERTVRFCGRDMQAVLGTNLAVPVEQRRRGYSKEMTHGIVRELYDRRSPVLLTYPFSAGFMSGQGFSLVNQNVVLAIDPHQLRMFPEYLQVRRASQADLPAMRACHERARQLPQHNGWVSRNEYEWQEWLWRSAPEAVLFEQNGSVDGYLLYTMQPENNHAPARVLEWVSATDAAWRGLAGFLAALGEQATAIHYVAPTNFPLWITMREPYGARTNNIDWTYWPTGQIAAGFMLRVIHLESAIEQRQYPEDMHVQFTLRVQDAILHNNSRMLNVSLADGSAAVERSAERKPMVETDIGTFGQLLTGFLDPYSARSIGRLQVDDATCAVLARAFAAAPLFLPEPDVF